MQICDELDLVFPFFGGQTGSIEDAWVYAFYNKLFLHTSKFSKAIAFFVTFPLAWIL